MNSLPLRLCLVLHNHQPVGNFDSVFEQAYQDSYLPFLDVFESFGNLKITLHISGPLARWLDEHHAEYMDRVADLVANGRIEIIGGPMSEPILTMLPCRDRIGQIEHYREWLAERFQARVHGMWMPERVWEPALTRDLALAGVQYTVLDDFHFQQAGFPPEELDGYYITEDEGRLLRIFPGSERLRYTIPFAEPDETIEFLRAKHEARPGAVLTFGDDGEKFGTWPETKQHVYDNRWLERFFQALEEQADWLTTCTLNEAVQQTPPRGRCYLPNASYREMSEWAFPVQRQSEFQALEQQWNENPQWPLIRSFIGGGFWRNFKVKYSETAEMYARMMYVSNLFDQAVQEGRSCQHIQSARDHLYQGQCNCAYWHGAFGGVYLPHLRNAVYRHLIQAEREIDRSYQRQAPWIEAMAEDFDFDGHPEIRLANDQLINWIAPHRGGCLYELDILSMAHNVLATMQRRPELYHDQITRQAAQPKEEHQAGSKTASIHDRVVTKQQGLENHLQYDPRPPKSLIDHFWDEQVDHAAITGNTAMERGDFADGIYLAKIRRKQDRIQVQLKRAGNAWGIPLTMTKGVTLSAGSHELEIAYLIEGLPSDRQFHFGIEFNFAGLPAGQDDRQFLDSSGQSLGHLGTLLDLQKRSQVHLVDQWLKLNALLTWDQPGGLWTYPIHAVSQSEGGFELVHQSTVVQPHWLIRGDRDGRWSVQLKLSLAHNQPHPPAAMPGQNAAELILDQG